MEKLTASVNKLEIEMKQSILKSKWLADRVG